MDYSKLSSLLPDTALTEMPDLPWPKLGSGKVRDIYDIGEHLLIIASDRLSAFDVILPDGIPGKGILLTQISLHWFAQCPGIIDNHLADDHENLLGHTLADHPTLRYRSMIVRKLQPLPLEAIVRAYLSGSGWKSYQNSGQLFEYELPSGLLESSALPQALFTPTSKAQEGHDEPITQAEASKAVGTELFAQVKQASLDLFQRGSQVAQQAGLILADTKFEFGTDAQGKLYLIDEILTPDSSRYWPADDYQAGRPQTAFDKQYVRDYLETLDWNKQYPGPSLPQTVIDKTLERYLQAAQALLATQ